MMMMMMMVSMLVIVPPASYNEFEMRKMEIYADFRVDQDRLKYCREMILLSKDAQSKGYQIFKKREIDDCLEILNDV